MIATPTLDAVVQWLIEVKPGTISRLRFRSDVWRRIREETGFRFIPPNEELMILGVPVEERRP